MRRLAGTLLVTLSGCLVANPEYDGATASDWASRGESGSTTAAPTTTGVTTTTGGEGSGSAGESTGGEVTTDPAATGEPTGGEMSSGTGSTGQPPPPPECVMATEKQIDVVPIDTGVVPATMGLPCPWGGGGVGCEILNFGRTQFYRLVNDGVAGRNAALITFPLGLVEQDIIDWGYSVDDLVGARLEFVVWEPLAQPAGVVEMQIDLLHAGDSDWSDGVQDALPAMAVEPNFQCKQVTNCVPWVAPGGPLASINPLGVLVIDPADQPALDKDGNGDEYHMQIKSELLPGAPIRDRMLVDKLAPSFAVSLKSARNLAEGAIGLKLWEAPWEGPFLHVQLCDEWN